MRIESDEIAEGLDSDDGTGDGIVFINCSLDKCLQAFAGAAAKIGQQLPIVEELTAKDFRDAEYEMPVRDLFENIHAEPFPEFDHALLMVGWAEMTALAEKCQQIFVAEIFAFYVGKAVAQITAIDIAIEKEFNSFRRPIA